MEYCCVGFRILLLLLLVLLTYLITATAVLGNGIMIEKNDEERGAGDHKEVVIMRGRKVEIAGRPRSVSQKMLASATNTHHKFQEYSESIRVLKSKTTAASEMTSINKKPKATARLRASLSHGQETDEEGTSLDDPRVTEQVFSMLHKDYQTRARRRPPINNAVPSTNTHGSDNKP